jgi:putative ABC transport system substrate-binding protein
MSSRSSADSDRAVKAFVKGLVANGFTPGKNVEVKYAWANGDYEQLKVFASSFVAERVTLIVAVGGVPSAEAAKQASSMVPIVFSVGPDPVKAGLVKSFNRPEANVTGVSLLTNALEAKRLGLIHELVRWKLVSYGIDLTDSYQHVGTYAARILRGTSPQELPVLQPTKFELVINLRTAKVLEITVPATLLPGRRGD